MGIEPVPDDVVGRVQNLSQILRPIEALEVSRQDVRKTPDPDLVNLVQSFAVIWKGLLEELSLLKDTLDQSPPATGITQRTANFISQGRIQAREIRGDFSPLGITFAECLSALIVQLVALRDSTNAEITTHLLQNGTRPLTDDWDNTGRRIRNTGVAEVSTTEPASPVRGMIWLDEDASGTGGLGVLNVTTITSSTTLTDSQTVVLCDATAGPITVTLPKTAGRDGRSYYIKKIDGTGNAVTVDGDGTETIDDSSTKVITSQYDAVTIVSDGTEWWIL